MKKQARKGFRFLTGSAVIGTVSYFLLTIVMPFLKNFTAAMSAGLLSLFGNAYSQAALIHYNSLVVQVIPLCVGDIEIAVLTGAILSTEDRSVDDRILGVVAAFVFVMLINALRIGVTMLAWEAYGIEAIEFIHSALFRVTLVVAIVGFYGVWYLRDLIKEKLELGEK